jgi:hypothetical protein
MKQVKEANKANGYFFFSADTMRFFDSKIVSRLDYNTQCFITSEKKCFEDYTKVYAVRQVNEEGDITTLARQLDTIEEAEEFIQDLAGKNIYGQTPLRGENEG